MRANDYKALEQAIDEGVDYGFVMAYKHNEAPSEANVREAVKGAVMASVGEWFTFDDQRD